MQTLRKLSFLSTSMPVVSLVYNAVSSWHTIYIIYKQKMVSIVFTFICVLLKRCKQGKSQSQSDTERAADTVIGFPFHSVISSLTLGDDTI